MDIRRKKLVVFVLEHKTCVFRTPKFMLPGIIFEKENLTSIWNGNKHVSFASNIL